MIKTITSASLLDEFIWLKTSLLVTIFFFLAFWIYFFALEYGDPRLSPAYLAHELSFPIPDFLWIVSLLLLSIYWLRRNNLKGIFSTVAAGSALVFLGLIDVSFNFQQGTYIKSLADGLLNGTVNLLCLGYGSALICVGYRLLQKYIGSN